MQDAKKKPQNTAKAPEQKEKETAEQEPKAEQPAAQKEPPKPEKKQEPSKTEQAQGEKKEAAAENAPKEKPAAKAEADAKDKNAAESKKPVAKPRLTMVTIEESRWTRCKNKLSSLGWKKWAAIAAVFIVLVGGGLGTYLAFGTTAVMQRSDRDAKENIYMTVKSGTTALEISERLTQLGVIDSRFRFWWLMKLQGDAGKFKTGTYAFKPHMDEQAVLDKLVAGDTTIVKFTIPEGFGVKEIAKRLADEGLVDEQDFLEKAKTYAPYDYMKKLPNERYAAEGYLFPDTYEIQSDVTPELIMKMMTQDFDSRLTPAMRQQAASMGLSIHDLVTLASLVEKEARYDEDRPIIAQVFLKRLQMGMPLQSDTTLQYLMAGPKENVSIADTKIDSPYNTYQHEGLPPGPIASPGIKAINAVLHPAATDYLYFVADHDGHNHYSKTYEEHLAIVEQVR
ncbi:endolytic transglycosylase MltG [uncultured Mitsuokella sp.]|uniref:endolytic transglycosylase MltG n=1 Tax=uncultured Mitsuokella sp. TaxID=453120 RepID=UPI00266EDAD3|nr:endolytic transglycosylase MltG [uncultured Mitsuokella sp.]